MGPIWDEALCSIDMALLLDPNEPDVAAAADAARTILVRLGAAPFIERLDEAMARRPVPDGHAARTALADPIAETADAPAS